MGPHRDDRRDGDGAPDDIAGAPRIAPIQCVIVPIVVKQSDAANKAQADTCAEMVAALGARVRVKPDDRTNYNPGWKYNHWELKGAA